MNKPIRWPIYAKWDQDSILFIAIQESVTSPCITLRNNSRVSLFGSSRIAWSRSAAASFGQPSLCQEASARAAMFRLRVS